jgi:hypothetical protein
MFSISSTALVRPPLLCSFAAIVGIVVAVFGGVIGVAVGVGVSDGAAAHFSGYAWGAI